MADEKKPHFAGLVASELISARERHRYPLASPHEAYAVILEELDEFKTEVFKRGEFRSRDQMLHELAQTAAMCQRAAEDLALIPRTAWSHDDVG